MKNLTTRGYTNRCYLSRHLFLTFPPQELIDVDFEFFDPVPDIDWHGIKRLLTQLLQADAPLFHLDLLTDLILSQPLIGSTVKCDGRESDPYAFLSVVNLNAHPVGSSLPQLNNRDY